VRETRSDSKNVHETKLHVAYKEFLHFGCAKRFFCIPCSLLKGSNSIISSYWTFSGSFLVELC